MAIPDANLYEYAVVRYVPRVDREEFLNIGLIMMCKRRKWLRGEIRLNEERIKAFYAGAELDSLERQASIFTREDIPSADIPVEERYRWLVAVKSAILQVSPSHPGLLADENPDDIADASAYARLDSEFETLFNDLVS